jgi:hypothetical protein
MSLKLFLAYANANGNTDGVTHSQLIQHLPLTKSLAEADAVIVLAVCHENFRFNHDLNKLVGKKPIVIVDYLEYGWQYEHNEDNVLGHGRCTACDDFKNNDWSTLDLWVREARPLFQFKRELRKEDAAPDIIPIDFLAHLPPQPLDSKAQFDTRPFDVFNSWGYSHPSRARVHGEIFIAMGTQSINVIDSYEKLGGNVFPFPTKTWLSVFTPHWKRVPMDQVLFYQSKSKISLSLYGAGWKCFRAAEAPENCIMGQQANNLAWSYEWDESNSIRLHEPDEVLDLIVATHRPDLYELYRASQATIDKYRWQKYVPNYFLKNIADRL